MKRLSVILQYILIAIAASIFLLVAVPKFLFPYEAHWMEGAMLGEISWILHGNHLYLPPNIYHVPSIYQPLYYFITSAITSITGLNFVTARLTSLIATSATLIIIYYVVRCETGKTFLGISAIGLYLAAFAKTEFGFLAARIDPLLTLLILGGAITIYYARTYRGLFIGAFLFSLSFFTKQSALVFIPFISLYLLLIHGWKKSLSFTAFFTIITFAGILALNTYYNGWYLFYTFDIPRSMGKFARWTYALNGLFSYIIARCWLVSIVLLFFPVRSFFQRSDTNKYRGSIFFGFFFIAAITAGFLGIVNPGGGHNVLLQTALACSLFLPIITSELSTHLRLAKFSYWFIPLQMLFLISNPWGDSRNTINKVDKINYENFYKYVQNLPGEVWIPYHSYTKEFTQKTEYAGYDFAAGAMLPVSDQATQAKFEFDTAYSNHHWNYILSDYRQTFPHYKLSDTMINLNKFHGSGDSLLYIYEPM
jgi:hypothetical protein